MKAFLLAAGLGSRLRPITDTTPKCLVEIAGHPLLDWWAKLFRESGVDKVLINTHYLADIVHKYISEFNHENLDIYFQESYESVLMGSAGTVKANTLFIEEQEDFLICYADNLTNMNLHELIRFHKEKNSIFTMALFRTNVPKQCGIVQLNQENRIIEFVEKPEEPKSNLANAGIYVANRKVIDLFPHKTFLDFGKDILPELVGQMYGYEIDDYLIDIGTMKNYQKAQEEWNYDYYEDSLTY